MTLCFNLFFILSDRISALKLKLTLSKVSSKIILRSTIIGGCGNRDSINLIMERTRSKKWRERKHWKELWVEKENRFSCEVHKNSDYVWFYDSSYEIETKETIHDSLMPIEPRSTEKSQYKILVFFFCMKINKIGIGYAPVAILSYLFDERKLSALTSNSCLYYLIFPVKFMASTGF